MIFKRRGEPHTDSIIKHILQENMFHDEQFRTLILHTNWSVAPQCIPHLVWGFLMRCRSYVESLMQSRSITLQSGNWNIKTAAPLRTKKRKCGRNMEIWDFAQFCHPSLPVLQFPFRRDWKVSQSPLLFLCLSKISWRQKKLRKKRERERRAKKGSAQIKHFIMSTNEARNSKRHYPRWHANKSPSEPPCQLLRKWAPLLS